MNIDFRKIELADINFEVSIIEKHLDFVKKEYEELKSNEQRSYEKEVEKLKGKEDEPGISDYEEARYLYDVYLQTVDIEIPRMLFGSYLVSLWSVLESSYIQLSGKYSKSSESALKLNDLKGSTIEQINKYYIKIIKKPYKPDDFNWEVITELHSLKDAHAYGNSRLSFLEEGLRDKIQRLEKKGSVSVKGADDSIIPTMEYLDFITRSICSLIRENMKMYASEKAAVA